MKTLLLCILTLGIRFVSSLSTEEGACIQDICCQFTGQGWDSSKNLYEFNMDDVQNSLERCQTLVFGLYLFDRTSEINTHVMESDKNALRSLAKCGKTVYIMISFYVIPQWSELLESQDDGKFNHHVNTLIRFVKKYNISGVIMQDIDIYDPEPPSQTDNIISLATVLKSKMKSLRVGLYIKGKQYESFSDCEKFDFGCSNDVLDHYFVDLSFSNKCTPGTKCESINPITSNDPNLITIEKMSKAVKESAMDKCKVYAVLLVSTVEAIDTAIANDDVDLFGTYSQMCVEAKNGIDLSTLCFDSTSMLYKQAKYVRDYFSGIMVSVVEGDDYNCDCGCRPFVATNALIDGWECNGPQICVPIDQLVNS